MADGNVAQDTQLHRARNIVVRAIANNANADNAQEVLSSALDQIACEAFVLQRAELDGLNDGADMMGALIRLQEHVAALGDFVEMFLDVRFSDERAGGAS